MNTQHTLRTSGSAQSAALLLLIVLAVSFAGGWGCDGCAPPATGLGEGGFDDSPPAETNGYPFVLVHGFFGWGRDELLGFQHFGGFEDIEADLRAAGYPTVTVSMGPLSSNWDRACEMYAQLIGGTVDYGAAHAAEHATSVLAAPMKRCSRRSGSPVRTALRAEPTSSRTARAPRRRACSRHCSPRETTPSGEHVPADPVATARERSRRSSRAKGTSGCTASLRSPERMMGRRWRTRFRTI